MHECSSVNMLRTCSRTLVLVKASGELLLYIALIREILNVEVLSMKIKNVLRDFCLMVKYQFSEAVVVVDKARKRMYMWVFSILSFIFSKPLFSKKVVLKNFEEFIGKPQCQSLFFNKVAGPRRWLPLVKLDPSLWYQQNFSFNCFWQHLISWGPSIYCDNNNYKTQCPQNSICGGVHWYCNSNFKTFKENNTVCSDMYSTVGRAGGYFEIDFWMIWLVTARLYLPLWQFDVRSHVTQDLKEIRVYFSISALRI